MRPNVQLIITSLKEIEKYYEEWQRLAVNICKGDTFLADDLLHDTITRLIQRDKYQELLDDGTLNNYVKRSMAMAFKYPSSSFHALFDMSPLEFNENSIDHAKLRTWIGARLDNETIDIAINRLPFFQKEVFLLWSLDDFSYTKLSDETGIPKKDLFLAVKESKKQLRKWLVRLQ